MSNPRNHHYVPKFYLAGFTRTGTVDDRLFVLDRQRRRQWPSSPRQAAHESDFYAIDVGPSTDPMVVEKYLAELEGLCAPVLRAIRDSGRFPQGEARKALLAFVALQAVRVPTIRRNISRFVDGVLKDLGQQMLGTEAGWQEFLTADGSRRHLPSMTQEEAANVVQSDELRFDLDQTWHVSTMLNAARRLAHAFGERNWSLWMADDRAPDLICSDRPVSVEWHTATPPPLLPAGFGVPKTLIIMPVNRRMAIAGAYEEQPTSAILDSQDVAVVNRSTQDRAIQLYSCDPDFVWAMTLDHIGSAMDLLGDGHERRQDERTSNQPDL
jgi:uncharacterized protein DUF4238